jgi:glutaryl-CoA dehydrogenase
MTQVASAHLGESLGTDFFSVREQFTDEQWSHFITVRRFVDLAEAGRLTPTVAGLAKMHNTRKARAITAEARDILGGNGILLDYQVIRHMVDMEAVHTFEGTETMQTLIVGRAITGIGAFS